MKHLDRYLNFFDLLKEEQTADTKIYRIPGDKYEYKVEDDNWLAKRKGTQKWFNITGGDYKQGYDKSINILDKRFPKARTEEAPRRGDNQPKETETPKEVEYTRDNGETATGTIVGVNKDAETVTIKGSESGKEFQKDFGDLKLADEELQKLAGTGEEPKQEEKPKPQETTKVEETPKKDEPKAEDKKTDTKDDQQRLLKASMNDQRPPKGLGGFLQADDKAKQYMKEQGAKVDMDSKTFVYPFPPEGKETFVYVSGYKDDIKDITSLMVGKEGKEKSITPFSGPDLSQSEIDDAFGMATDMLHELFPKTDRTKKG